MLLECRGQNVGYIWIRELMTSFLHSCFPYRCSSVRAFKNKLCFIVAGHVYWPLQNDPKYLDDVTNEHKTNFNEYFINNFFFF